MNDQLLSINKVAHDDRRAIAETTLVAETIAHIFHDIFGIETGIDDDFFDLGGDSLTGETLLAGVEREIGIALPLSVLLESSTPRSLANAIAARQNTAPPTILFKVSDAGSRTPLFCIHGANGTATFSRKLREVLSDRPIYAVRALGFLPGEVPLISIPEIAQLYIGDIRKVRPSGPYHLFGQCRTANVAYEVAQQLSAAGERVATVTLADPLPMERTSRLHRLRHWLKGRRAIRTALQFPQMSGDERWHKVAKPALVAATKAYEPRPYSGKVLLVSASDRARELLHPKNGYPALIPHLEAVVVEGTHRDVFTALAPGAASKFAGAMSSFLARHD